MKIIRTKLRGGTFVCSQEYLKNIEKNDELICIREPENLFDVNAIKVYHRTVKIGYLSRALAKDLIGKKILSAKVLSVNTKLNLTGINFEVILDGD